MAHPDQFAFIELIKRHNPASFEGVRVLEIGSLDLNGSVRSFFARSQYVGVDVAAGPGVDEVCQGQLVGCPSGTFDVVISCECLEHNPFWSETVANMFRMAKPGGLVVVSCATTGRAEHGTTRSSKEDSPLSVGIGWEYYRNIPRSVFRRAFNLPFWCEDYVLLSNWNNFDLYFVGVMKSSSTGTDLKNLRKDLEKRFSPFRGARAFCVFVTVSLFGRFGLGFLRVIWQRFAWLRAT